MKAWSPAAWLALALAAAPANAQTMPPQEYMDRARELLAELIEIDTTDSQEAIDQIVDHNRGGARIFSTFPNVAFDTEAESGLYEATADNGL